MGETLVFGVAGTIFLALDFQMAPILLGYVLGPMVEETFRRALLLSGGDLAVFVHKPISAVPPGDGRAALFHRARRCASAAYRPLLPLHGRTRRRSVSHFCQDQNPGIN